MATASKDTKVTVSNLQDSNAIYSAEVSASGPNQGYILSLKDQSNNKPINYDLAKIAYTGNKITWDNTINKVLTANNTTNQAAPTSLGVLNQDLYSKLYSQNASSVSSTQSFFNPGAGSGAPTDVNNLAGDLKDLDNLVAKPASKPPSTANKIYVFPQDMNVGKYGDSNSGTPQDYIRIGALKYQPPQPGLIVAKGLSTNPFSVSTGIEKLVKVSPKLVGNGLADLNASLPKFLNFIGEVVLPMPLNVTDGAQVEWGVSKMSIMGAAMASGLSGLYDTGVLGGAAEFANALGIGGAAAAKGSVTAYAAASGLQKLAGNPAAADALRADIISEVISKVTNTPVNPGDLLTRSTGAAVNPNAQLLFKSPSLRSFDLTWKLTPRSSKEATIIKNIIRFFKINMLPYIPEGQGSVLLQSPNVFVLRYEKSNGTYNKSLPKPKLCALVQMQANHTPDGVGWAAYNDSHPVTSTLSMTFMELSPLLANDYSSTTEDDVGL